MTSTNDTERSLVMATDIETAAQEAAQEAQQVTGGENVPLPENTPASTEPVLCLVLVPGKEGEEAKPCQKAKNHQGDHSVRKYTKVDTSVVTLDMLAVFDEDEEEELPEGDIRVTESGYVPTTPQELLVKANLETSHAAWVRNGKPKNFNAPEAKLAWGKYRVEPDNEAAVRKMLKDTATYLGIHVRIAPRVKLKNGEFRLIWMAVDKSPARKRSGTSPTENSTAPTSQSASTDGGEQTATGDQTPAEPEKPAEEHKPAETHHHVPTPEEMVKAAAERHSRSRSQPKS